MHNKQKKEDRLPLQQWEPVHKTNNISILKEIWYFLTFRWVFFPFS